MLLDTAKVHVGVGMAGIGSVSNRLSESRVGHEECGVEETEFSEIHKWN